VESLSELTETSNMELPIYFNFVEVARLDQVPPGTGSVFTAADKNVAVFNVCGKLFAIADACPHAGASLGMGKLDGSIVTCPWHGMKFDVTTGCFAGTSDSGVAKYRVKIEDGKIMVAS
jgi:nitrite reductase/ring-hydroxylating ferredoxin subunit